MRLQDYLLFKGVVRVAVLNVVPSVVDVDLLPHQEEVVAEAEAAEATGAGMVELSTRTFTCICWATFAKKLFFLWSSSPCPRSVVKKMHQL